MERERNAHQALVLLAAICLPLISALAVSASVPIETVPVGNPGNAPSSSGFGAVNYNYNIGKYDVTAGQYSAFLNAVAATDTFGLYNTSMGDGSAACGIAQSGTPGSYTYTTTKNANYPVNYVSFWNAARFANWLANGQPTGSEGPGTTETGTYTLTPTGIANNTVTRNPGSTWAITSENEWYKAAYYNPASSSYYLYPTQSNSDPSNVLSATGTNNANYRSFDSNNNPVYSDPTNFLTAVGAFAASPSAYGTYDQGGDVRQWNETINSGTFRSVRAGAFDEAVSLMQSRTFGAGAPSNGVTDIGFRVSQTPEPSSLALLGLSAIGILRRPTRGKGATRLV